jgi:hypothetical protein
MAGGAYGQAGLGIMGGTLGGIGDIIQAQNYHRPRLPPATGYEQRLRQLAQSQLLGGGQQLLGGTALYNQMAPILMGMLPGMRYVPGAGDGAGGAGGEGAPSPVRSYQSALANVQQRRAKQEQLTALKAQIKGLKPGSERRGLRKQRKSLSRELKGLPSAAELDRQAYMAGTTPSASLYDIRTAPAPATSDLATSTAGSLGAYRGLMDALTTGTPSIDLSALYEGAGGY